MTSSDVNLETNKHSSAQMVVLFGRPGSGKTTISQAAMEVVQKQNKDEERSKHINCICLDLDVCIPEWMKENFGKGIYPTLDERIQFALSACDYVDSQIQQQHRQKQRLTEQQQQHITIKTTYLISFSFVNTDLRDTYRSRFPNATWVLVDTNEKEAQRRIDAREGHFYNGEVSSTGVSEKNDNRASITEENDIDQNSNENSDWKFAPVTFPHVILDGTDLIEKNAQTVVDIMVGRDRNVQ